MPYPLGHGGLLIRFKMHVLRFVYMGDPPLEYMYNCLVTKFSCLLYNGTNNSLRIGMYSHIRSYHGEPHMQTIGTICHFM